MTVVDPRTISRPHVWLPAADSSTAQTLFLLHGTGADEHDLINLGRALNPEANLLSVRGLVVADGMARFFMRFEDGSFDETGIVCNADELASFLADAARAYGFDANRVVAVGFSNGANAAGSLLLCHPESVCAVAAFGTTKSFVSTEQARSGGLPDLSGKTVWIANGATDGYSPSAKTQAMVHEFEQLGASVELMVHPGGHMIVMDHVQAIAQAIRSL
jgi:predicted esterase